MNYIVVRRTLASLWFQSFISCGTSFSSHDRWLAGHPRDRRWGGGGGEDRRRSSPMGAPLLAHPLQLPSKVHRKRLHGRWFYDVVPCQSLKWWAQQLALNSYNLIKLSLKAPLLLFLSFCLFLSVFRGSGEGIHEMVLISQMDCRKVHKCENMSSNRNDEDWRKVTTVGVFLSDRDL